MDSQLPVGAVGDVEIGEQKYRLLRESLRALLSLARFARKTAGPA